MSGRLTILEIEKIRKMTEAASPGPWWSEVCEYVIDSDDARICETTSESCVDSIFIAESRTVVPRLLTEVETLITEKAAARRMLDELIGEMANAAEAGYALAPETVRSDLEKIRKELIDHGE